jgi:hypothetical protein
MPYLSRTLTSHGAFISNYYGVGHNSLDNYIAMVSGQAPNVATSGDCPTFTDFPPGAGLDANGQQIGLGCVYPAGVPTLMSQLTAAHLTWRGYMQGMGTDPRREGGTCGHPALDTPDGTEGGESSAPYDEYATRHDPFVYFHSVIDDASTCDANVVNLSRLATDLHSTSTTANFTFITPDLCGDGHDDPCHDPNRAGGAPGADAFLRTVVPEITASPAFKQDGLLVVTFDEAESGDDSSACCGERPGPGEPAPGQSGPGGGKVGAVLLSRFIKPGTTTTAAYNHYSLLGSVEDLFGLSRLADANGTTRFGSDVFTNAAPAHRVDVVAAMRHEPLPTGRSARIGRLLSHGLRLTVALPEAGRLTTTWTARVHHGRNVVRVTVAKASVSAKTASRKPVVVRLTKRGRALLKDRRSLTVAVDYRFVPTSGGDAGEAARTVRLRR